MPSCKKCQSDFPNRLKIDDKYHCLKNRKYCLQCSPFGSGNRRDLTKPEKYNRRKGKPKESTYYTNYSKRRREEYKKRAVEYCGGKCRICNYNKCLRALEFHHINANNKLFSISGVSYTKQWEEVKAELDKCILLCSNCHKEVEDGCTILPHTGEINGI